MKKIAFLFLVIDNPNFTDIWDEYLKGFESYYTIYIHPKYLDKLCWRPECVIKNLQPTGWGYITQAYIELYKAAFIDIDNYKFITISESCVPITSFEKFYNKAVNDPCSWIKIMKLGSYDITQRIQNQKTKPKPKKIIKHYARSCLNRYHVNQLLLKTNELNFFHQMHVGDEFYLSVLYPLKNIKDFAVTTDDWEWVNKQKKELKNKIRQLYEIQEKTNENKLSEINELKKIYDKISANPKTIDETKPELKNILNSSSFFYRKFSLKSDIRKYWKYIISKH